MSLVPGLLLWAPNDTIIENHLAEVTIRAAVVQWDESIAPLCVALVNRDPRRFSAYLREKVKDCVRDKFGDDVAAWVTLTLPKHPSKKLTQRLLDRRGFVPAFNAKQLQQRARELFIEHVARRFDLSPSETASIEAWRALRDFVGKSRGDSSPGRRRLHTPLV